MVLLSVCERGGCVIRECERWLCYQRVREVVVLSESERGGCVIRE